MNHDDMALVREFAASQSERAFATLVERHVGLVHSAALRRVGQPHLAEEITQAVFILLARKAPSLRHQTILSGWLYRTTGFVAADALKQLRRRTHHEEDAYMQSTLDNAEIPVWKDLAPFLESAMDRLGERDRNALLLRYFEGKTLAEVGVALGVSEDAARVRVNRALEKLHQYFKDRGIVSTTAVLAEVVSANSVQPVRAGLAASISVVALTQGATAGPSTLTLVKGALKIMVWTKFKTVAVAGAALILCAGTPVTIHVVRQIHAQSTLFSKTTELTDEQNAEYQRLTGATPAEMARAFIEACAAENWSELGKYWPNSSRNQDPAASIPMGFKTRYGGLQLVTFGKPFTARINIAAYLQIQPESRKDFPSTEGDFASQFIYVPYEVRQKDGNIRKWQMSIQCDNPEHRWYFNGGF